MVTRIICSVAQFIAVGGSQLLIGMSFQTQTEIWG